MSTKQQFDWWQQNITNEIYLNTHRKDWWEVCIKVAGLLEGTRSIIDIGGGDGHTLWQILSVAENKGCVMDTITFVEPSKTGLGLAKHRLKQLGTQTLKTYRGMLETFDGKLLKERAYDVLYAGHVNYYFGKQSGTTYNLKKYEEALALLPKIADRVILMTASKDSDYYKVVSKNPFGPAVYGKNVATFYRSRGYKVEVINTSLRFYVSHALLSFHEATLLWKFFHDTERRPTQTQVNTFVEKLRATMDKDGYINFKDQIIVVSK